VPDTDYSSVGGESAMQDCIEIARWEGNNRATSGGVEVCVERAVRVKSLEEEVGDLRGRGILDSCNNDDLPSWLKK